MGRALPLVDAEVEGAEVVECLVEVLVVAGEGGGDGARVGAGELAGAA